MVSLSQWYLAFVGSPSSSPHPLWHRGLVSWETVFPRAGCGGRFWGSLSMFHLLCTSLLLLLYRLHLRASGALDPGSRGPLSYYHGQYSPKQGKILPLRLPHAPHGETLCSSGLGVHEVGYKLSAFFPSWFILAKYLKIICLFFILMTNKAKSKYVPIPVRMEEKCSVSIYYFPSI